MPLLRSAPAIYSPNMNSEFGLVDKTKGEGSLSFFFTRLKVMESRLRVSMIMLANPVMIVTIRIRDIIPPV